MLWQFGWKRTVKKVHELYEIKYCFILIPMVLLGMVFHALFNEFRFMEGGSYE